MAAKDELKPVYLLSGNDRPKIELALERLRRRFGGAEIVSAADTSGDAATAACNTLDLFAGEGEGRLVIVEDVDGRLNRDGRLVGGWKAADVKAVAAYLEAPAPGAVLALVAEKLGATSPLGKAVAAKGEILLYEVNKRGLPRWVADRFKKRGIAVDADACRALIDLVGDDARELASEVDKIATWSAGEAVTEAEVRRLAAPVAETAAYAITDAWGKRDAGAALAATELVFERAGRTRRDEVARIAASMASHVSRASAASRLADAGVSPRDAASRLGVRTEWQARKLYEHAAEHGAEGVARALVRWAELDHAVKGGSRLAADLELQRALVDVTRRPGPHRDAG
jgi:DNA polymerase-3 subunit delta